MTSSQEEQTASRAFVSTLLKDLETSSSNDENLKFVMRQIVPVLMPAIVHLLKAIEANKEWGGDIGHVTTIRPLDYIARYMIRRNPRFNKSASDTVESKR